MGCLKQTGLAAPPRPGEGAVRIAKQLGFQQVSVERRAVDGHEWPIPPRAGIVDALGEHLLTGAGFAVQHHGELRIRKIFGEALCFKDGGRLPQNIREPVFCHQSLFVQLDTDVPLCCLQGLDVLKGRNNALYLPAYPDGDAVGGDQRPVNVHHLAYFGFSSLKNTGQVRIGQDLFDGPPGERRLRRTEHLLCDLVGRADPAILVNGDDRVMGIIQNVLVTLQLDLKLFLLAGVLLLGDIKLLGDVQSMEDRSVRAFHPEIRQVVQLGEPLRHDAAQPPCSPIGHRLLDSGLAAETVGKAVVLHFQIQKIADGAQLVADLFLKGKESNKPPLVPKLLDGRDIIRCFAGDVHDLNVQTLAQQVAGAAAADKQIIVLRQKPLGQRNGGLQLCDLHTHIHASSHDQGLGPPGQIFGGRDEADFWASFGHGIFSFLSFCDRMSHSLLPADCHGLNTKPSFSTMSRLFRKLSFS